MKVTLPTAMPPAGKNPPLIVATSLIVDGGLPPTCTVPEGVVVIVGCGVTTVSGSVLQSLVDPESRLPAGGVYLACQK